MNAGWDNTLLEIEIDTLSELKFDLDLLGWDELPQFVPDVDYAILDDYEIDDQLEQMNDDVKKAIQIEFELHDYDEAKEIVRFFRTQGAYVGGLIMMLLSKEKALMQDKDKESQRLNK